MTDQPEALPGGDVPSAEELEWLVHGGPPAPVPGRRTYPGRDSSDHARRLLRRAVNADRPGEETLRLLAAARGYLIERVPDPAVRPVGRAWCSVYAHAFLLADDSELCLYELEHDHTPDGRLVCEVYPDRRAAGLAARRHTGRPEGGPSV
ncbi:DUF6227 family protein [Streptomyces sp. RFCAC02]|uniref:DUF6227 family protein n=1 Tax=Streptomyces sp. RFCAC02 TaxID=2499143 RepID=UPI001021F3B1|nr:DUF6227 family protein [Streptomyces sp. RFCAC02]